MRAALDLLFAESPVEVAIVVPPGTAGRRAAELALFHAVKAAFDEHALLNPGKAVPTLQRCAEFGRMHVHAGAKAEKFADIPRY